MTALTRTPQNTNYLQPTKFLLTFDRIKTVQYFCQSANLPGLSLGEATINTPTIDLYVPSTKLKYNTFTVVFTVDEAVQSWKELYNWFLSMAAPSGFDERNQLKSMQNYNKMKESNFSDGTLTILSALNNPIAAVQFENMFPLSLSDIQFDTKLSADTIITASATFRYDSFKFI